MAVFCAYMRLLMPLANGRDTTVSDPMVQTVSSNLDFLLPFRQCAPTMQKAMETIYSEPRRLLTQAGLFNAIAFRAVFYGSEYATESLRFFGSLDEWTEYHASVEQEKGTTDTAEYERQVRERREAKARRKKGVPSEMSERQRRLRTGPTERFFVNCQAYKMANVYRNTIYMNEYWDAALALLRKIEDKPLARDLHHFLCSKEFPNIGPLTALLIIGDLVVAGAYPMPSAEEWGFLVASLKLGAERALLKLGIPSDSNPNATQKAFVDLDRYMLKALTKEEHKAIKYNIITLEHSLCKYQRVY